MLSFNFLLHLLICAHCSAKKSSKNDVAKVDNILIDSDTTARTIIRNHDGTKLHLVMSDEFNEAGRSFEKGKDLKFEAVQKPDNTNEAMQFYNSSTEYVTTEDGNLVITARAVKTSWLEWDREKLKPYVATKNYTSGMIQSWNKFCFTGGVLEMAIELPGQSSSGGLWPAAWLMGNLARATFEKTTMFVWPWSYDKCGEIAEIGSKQLINACEKNPGHGLNPHQGRGSPEIDIFEVMPGHEMPGSGDVEAFMSSSLQVSPGIPKASNRPKNGHKLNSSYVWYEDIHMGKGGYFNDGFWGQQCGPEKDTSVNQIHKYMQDAISVNTYLEETHFNSSHIYKLEWQPGKGGYLYWYLDDKLLLGIDSISLERLTDAFIPTEPMYMILNTALSHRWGMPEPCPKDTCSACWHCYDCTNPECQCSLPKGMRGCKNLPAKMKIDYIRLYQDLNDKTHTIGCSPPNFPTAGFIEANTLKFKDWEPVSEEHAKIYWIARYSILAVIVIVIALTLIFLWLKVLEVCDSRHLMRQQYEPISDEITP